MRESEIVSTTLARRAGLLVWPLVLSRLVRLGALGLEVVAQLALDDLALDGPHVVDEQPPIQVVVLVLQRTREQGLALRLERLAFEIHGPHARAHAALHGHEDSRKRQAALVARLGLRRDLDDLRVQEHPGRRALLAPRDGAVDDEE